MYGFKGLCSKNYPDFVMFAVQLQKCNFKGISKPHVFCVVCKPTLLQDTRYQHKWESRISGVFACSYVHY